MCAGLLHLRQVFGYLVVHAAPLGNDTVASVVGQATDGAVLVLDADNTRRVAARNAKQTLEAARVPLLGTVLNDRTFPIPEKLYRRL
jgi:Mrp family chromosome partitioning ATPase